MDLKAHASKDASESAATEVEAMRHPRMRLHAGFSSEYLPDQRNLIVYLPPGYEEEPERSFPEAESDSRWTRCPAVPTMACQVSLAAPCT